MIKKTLVEEDYERDFQQLSEWTKLAAIKKVNEIMKEPEEYIVAMDIDLDSGVHTILKSHYEDTKIIVDEIFTI